MDDRLVRQALTGFVKLVLNLRLAALVLTLLWLPHGPVDDPRVISLVLLGVGSTSLVPVLAWDRVGPLVLRHPLMLGPDLVMAIVILSTLSVDTPFILFVLATAMLAGALHETWGAVAASVALLLAHVTGLLSAGAASFTEVLGVPMLVPAAAAGGVAGRRLLVTQATAARRLADVAMAGAAATERTRLAREMHDSLAKTLHGISLTAATMPALVHQRPEAASDMARTVAATAQQAAAEARALLVDLRADDLERPLGASVRDLLDQWSRRTGIRVTADLDDLDRASPSSRYELFCILREALRNVAEHADARHVRVSLLDHGDVAVATIVDDGRGFTAADDAPSFAADGHFGIVGMVERAESVGGRAHLTSAPGRGTRVEVEVPVTAPGDAATPVRPDPAVEVPR